MSEAIHPHPGLILKCRLRERGIGFFNLGSKIGVSEDELKDVLDLRLPMSLTMCAKLSKFFDDDLDFWLKHQINYELSLVAFETSYPNRHKVDLMNLPLPDRFG